MTANMKGTTQMKNLIDDRTVEIFEWTYIMQRGFPSLNRRPMDEEVIGGKRVGVSCFRDAAKFILVRTPSKRLDHTLGNGQFIIPKKLLSAQRTSSQTPSRSRQLPLSLFSLIPAYVLPAHLKSSTFIKCTTLQLLIRISPTNPPSPQKC